jgi:pyruvate dehydrogenase E1 component alpha subunit
MDDMRLKELYRSLLRIRLVEEHIAERYAEQEMRCPVHLSTGQEAVAVGACAPLTADDYMLSAHRAHAHYLAKGGDLQRMIAELYLRSTGCCGGRGGSMHLNDPDVGFLGAVPIVGSSIALAVGTALKISMMDESRVATVFLGDAAVEEGVFHESVNFAVLRHLPILFLCENNLYSVYTHLSERQPGGRSIADLARGYGIESFAADGNDVLEVERLTRQATDKARGGGGPTFLEFSTYRWREHCGPNYDNDLGYRTEAEFLEWQARDPLARFESVLRQQELVDDASKASLNQDIEQEIEAAFAFAKSSPFPQSDTLDSGVYA